MSEEKKNGERPLVDNSDNSWIVCKSNSRIGLVYYFNTKTGKAVWNLSNAEVEKAKQRTKHLEAGLKPRKCPEPKDKPPSIPFNISEPPQSLSSQQFVRVSEQQSSVSAYSNVVNYNASYTFFNQIPGVMRGTQIGNPTIEPMSNFNPLNTYDLNTTLPVYNPQGWGIPHAQQVFVRPRIAPVVNHSLGPRNVAYSHFSISEPQHATGHVFNSFENQTTSGTRKFPYATTNQNDLRQKLSSKKRFYTNKMPGGPGLLKGVHSNDLRTGLEHRVDSQLHKETPYKIDLDPLRKLAPYNSNLDAWYIVVDLQVLLQEFKLVTTLTDSDEICHLMVPKRVVEELQNYVIMTEDTLSKRILRFLSQQIEIGYAFMAEQPSELEDDTMAEAIYKTCKELLDKQYHLVLLTNDNELFTKCSSSMCMFRTEDIKKKLIEYPNKQLVSPGPKEPVMSDEFIRHVKIVPNDGAQKISTINNIQITVPNDGARKTSTMNNIWITVPNDGAQKTSTINNLQITVSNDGARKTSTMNNIWITVPNDAAQKTSTINNIQITVPNDYAQKISTISPVRDINSEEHIGNNPKTPSEQNNTTNKSKVDAGIQTDLEEINASISMMNLVEKQCLHVDANVRPQNIKEAITGHTVHLVSNILDKKRDTKRKPSTSHQPQETSVESETEQSKWRRM